VSQCSQFPFTNFSARFLLIALPVSLFIRSVDSLSKLETCFGSVPISFALIPRNREMRSRRFRAYFAGRSSEQFYFSITPGNRFFAILYSSRHSSWIEVIRTLLFLDIHTASRADFWWIESSNIVRSIDRPSSAQTLDRRSFSPFFELFGLAIEGLHVCHTTEHRNRLARTR
jgi:hypothetical protein